MYKHHLSKSNAGHTASLGKIQRLKMKIYADKMMID